MRRSSTMVYSVPLNGETIQICKAFISLHGIDRGGVEYTVKQQKNDFMVHGSLLIEFTILCEVCPDMKATIVEIGIFITSL